MVYIYIYVVMMTMIAHWLTATSSSPPSPPPPLRQPFPAGSIRNLRVLDLGSGSGRDCYVCAALVGLNGTVTGVDMTKEQLDVARRHVDAYTRDVLGYPATNMRFVEGHIEDLKSAGIADDAAVGT